MSSKRQQTMAKREREQRLREKRELKQQKKLAAKLAKTLPPQPADDEPALQADYSGSPPST